MHIAYIHQYFVPPTGAGGTRSLEFARRLVRWGHQVTLITSDAFFPEGEKVKATISREIEGIHLRIIPVPYANTFSYSQRIGAFGRFAVRSLREVLALRDVDVVFATSTPLTVVFPGVLAKLRHRVPMVFEVRDLWPELPIAMGALDNPVLRLVAKGMERFAYRSATEVVALSPGMKAGVVAKGVPEAHVHVIPNSSDVDAFRNPIGGSTPFLEKHPHLRGKRLVMYAGTLGAINGVGYLVRVARAMQDLDESVHFVIVGRGQEREEVEGLAKELGVIGTSLTILDPIPKAEMPHALAAATVLMSLFIDLPEMWHNSANKFFDALAAGKPVAINYGGWQSEVLDTSGAGIRLSATNHQAAAQSLLNLMNSEEQVRAAGKSASHLADTRFNRDHLARQVLEVLQHAAA